MFDWNQALADCLAFDIMVLDAKIRLSATINFFNYASLKEVVPINISMKFRLNPILY